MTGSALAAAGIGFASGFMNSMKELNAYRAQAKQLYLEAQVQRRNAARVRLAGALNEDTMRSHNRAGIASSLAAMGEAGMGESPTTTTAIATSASAMEQNVLNSRYETESEAQNYLYQARVAEANARTLRKKSKNRFTNAMLSGATSALGMYYSPAGR